MKREYLEDIFGCCVLAAIAAVFVGIVYLIYLGMSAVMDGMSPAAQWGLVMFFVGFSLGIGVKR